MMIYKQSFHVKKKMNKFECPKILYGGIKVNGNYKKKLQKYTVYSDKFVSIKVITYQTVKNIPTLRRNAVHFLHKEGKIWCNTVIYNENKSLSLWTFFQTK